MAFDINENNDGFVISDYVEGDALPELSIMQGDKVVIKIQNHDIHVENISFIDDKISGKISDIGNIPAEEFHGFKVGDDILFESVNVFGSFR